MNSKTDDDFIIQLNTSLDNLNQYYHLVDTSNSLQNNNQKQNSNNNSLRSSFTIMDYFFSSDSPILSNTNSDAESNHGDLEEDDCFDDQNEYIPKQRFKKLTLKSIKRSLDNYYDSDDKYSSEIDILTTFLNGQKHMYSRARSLAYMQLNSLMIPALVGAGAITIFAPFIQDYSWSGSLISGLNAAITLCMSIIHYLKLESTVESYSQLVSHYDRLENSLQNISSKLLFIEDGNERTDLIMKGIDDYEKKMVEIKEMNPGVVSLSIRNIFPIISHINIFSFIKRMETYKKNLMIIFKDVKNELRYIYWKFGDELRINNTHPIYKRIEILSKKKCELKEELLHYRSAYGYMDELILKEIKVSERISIFRQIFFNYTFKKNFSYSNPVVQQYLEYLFI
jgi:hypothetical protein